MSDSPVANLQQWRSHLRGVLRVAVTQVSTHHATDDPILIDSASAHIESLDGVSVADDGDCVGDLLNLVQLVADHDASDAASLQFLQQAQQVG